MNDDLALDAMFPEPPRPPTPPPTASVYTRPNGQKIEIRLVGEHPLWGHYLWNSARCVSDYIGDGLCRAKRVLELGAGGGLPSIVAAMDGARTVVVTDYPDRALVENLEFNVRRAGVEGVDVEVKGYVWGSDVKPLGGPFDVVILSDLVFNHSQHEALLKTCEMVGEEDVVALVFYTHHRPHLKDRDLEFFEKAKERGWKCETVVQRRYEPMFPDDPGEEDVRAMVYGWELRR